ncbi:hypothetical protein ACFFX0_19625 [Citricoccus parietis]|uniref:Uncharacterized protein n=1 Tax=Citricoccus parietis TaxID=592307 RepID=A0ABV5G2X6_9MICC
MAASRAGCASGRGPAPDRQCGGTSVRVRRPTGPPRPAPAAGPVQAATTSAARRAHGRPAPGLRNQWSHLDFSPCGRLSAQDRQDFRLRYHRCPAVEAVVVIHSSGPWDRSVTLRQRTTNSRARLSCSQNEMYGVSCSSPVARKIRWTT